MRKLYDITATQAVDTLVKTLRENHPEISKATAKKLICNALIYNCVNDEVMGQAEFLMEDE